MKKIFLFIFITLVYAQLHAQTYNLNTGVNESTGNFIPIRDNDDTWSIVKPSGFIVNAKVCSPYAGWAASNGCSRWITEDLATFNNGPAPSPIGFYKFRTSIRVPTIETCNPITSVTLNLSSIAGDNDIQWVRINGNQYNIVPGINNFGSFVSEVHNITASHIISGGNLIEIGIYNTSTVLGLNLCCQITINRVLTPLVPTIIGNNTYCQGGQLSFTGSAGPGTATNYFWEILEWNTSTGQAVPGGYAWSSWYTGTPGSFTFPTNSLQPCNRTYKVKLAMENSCQNLVETNKFIYFACNPINAGPNQQVDCPNNCVQIGTPAQTGYAYLWTNSSGTMIGNTAQITVCPLVTSTYTLRVTNLAQNCSGTDNVTVFVGGNNNPSFTTSLVTNSHFFTCTATPVVTNANTVAGFGEMYIVEEIDGSGNTITGTRSADGNNPNPSCWWVYPLAVNFKGYNALKIPIPGDSIEDVNSNANCHLVNPPSGKFRVCHDYRITRGTWNNNCPWAQYSKIVTFCAAEGNKMVVPVVLENVAAPNYSYLRYPKPAAPISNDGELVYPNPGKGVFTVTTAKYSGGSLTVFNPMGQLVKRANLGKNQATFTLDLTGQQPGTYMVKIVAATGSSTEKLVLMGQ